MIGCTKEGSMYYLENNELKKEYDNSFNSDENNSYAVCITPFSKGFFVGSQLGEIAMWVRSEENNATSGKDAYDFIRKISPPSTKNQKIIGLSMSANEDTLAVGLLNNNIGLVNIKSIGLNEDVHKDIKFELVCKGFHSGAISGIDVAV
jgi:hypothetical protein